MNPQQSAWKAEALPIELLLHKMAGAPGFEPRLRILEILILPLYYTPSLIFYFDQYMFLFDYDN